MRILRIILLPSILLALLVPFHLLSQTYSISPFAGGLFPPNSPATTVPIGNVNGVAVDSAGNVFLASGTRNAVLRLDAKSGLLTVVAGNGTQGFSGDNGPAVTAQLSAPIGGALDSAGTLYIADAGDNRIRKVSHGVITTVATLNPSSLPAIAAGPAMIYSPPAIAVDPAGALYITDSLQSRILKLANGVTTTVAGNGTSGFGGDNGPATSAHLNSPYGIAVDSAGALYIADTGNNRIRKVANGIITTLAGSGAASSGVDSGDNGPASAAVLNSPWFVAVDSAGKVYFTESGSLPTTPNGGALIYHNTIRMVANGIVTVVAGNGTQGFTGDGGPAINAQFAGPSGLAVDPAGSLYVADSGNYRIRKVTNGIIATFAGNGTLSFGGDNGAPTNAQFYYPNAIALDTAGALYIADSANNRIRKIANGLVTTVAGNGAQDFSGDGGPATSAALFLAGRAELALDSAGALYIADSGNNRIRKVTNGVITTVAGNGAKSYSGDNGPATSAALSAPTGVAVDSSGNLYIADTDNNRIRKVSNGVITTIAGNGTPGFSGDGGPALSAFLNTPLALALDSAANLYIADYANGRVRKISNGVITTIADIGSAGFSSGNFTVISGGSYSPIALSVDAAGSVYIVESNNRITKIANGIFSTVAGIGLSGTNDDYGPATSATLLQPCAVAADPTGRVHVADSGNNRIRVLTPTGPSITPSITAITNAASNLSGPIAPGEIVVLPGLGLGPAQLTSAPLAGDGLYDPQLSATTVKFNGIPAPVLYTWAGQVSAIVPYELTGSAAQVTVAYQAQTSATITVAVAPSAPGIFTLNATGQGQAAAINQDGTLNTPLSPAPLGSFISLYATGEGQTSPRGIDGKPASTSPPAPLLPVRVTIGGVTVTNLQYAGGAPGEVAGLLQINVQIPAGIAPGSAVPVSLQIGTVSSPPGVTIAVVPPQ